MFFSKNNHIIYFQSNYILTLFQQMIKRLRLTSYAPIHNKVGIIIVIINKKN